ncbi:hypothetical protein Bca101_050525 [Brassica carinata]
MLAPTLRSFVRLGRVCSVSSGFVKPQPYLALKLTVNQLPRTMLRLPRSHLYVAVPCSSSPSGSSLTVETPHRKAPCTSHLLLAVIGSPGRGLRYGTVARQRRRDLQPSRPSSLIRLCNSSSSNGVSISASAATMLCLPRSHLRVAVPCSSSPPGSSLTVETPHRKAPCTSHLLLAVIGSPGRGLRYGTVARQRRRDLQPQRPSSSIRLCNSSSSNGVSAVKEGKTWMTPLVRYLEADTLPKDRNEARKIKKQAARYCISQEKLYRRSFSGPYLRCVTPREAARILVEVHEGDCGSHSSGRSLVLRARRVGYYWPMMAADADKQAKHCDQCQRHATNKTMVNMLKKRLEGSHGKWAEELHGVLRAYQTTPKTETGETPYTLVYGSEAIVPTKMNVRTTVSGSNSQEENNELMALSLDLLDEKREAARLRNWSYQQDVARTYNK